MTPREVWSREFMPRGEFEKSEGVGQKLKSCPACATAFEVVYCIGELVKDSPMDEGGEVEVRDTAPEETEVFR
jgi:hypothetical protein